LSIDGLDVSEDDANKEEEDCWKEERLRIEGGMKEGWIQHETTGNIQSATLHVRLQWRLLRVGSPVMMVCRSFVDCLD
jgi:hypothetical protein